MAFFVYMKQNESAPYDNNIWFQKNVNRNLVSDGTIFPSQINSTYNEDNPHIERLLPNSLILFLSEKITRKIRVHSIYGILLA